jgi:hypothetical protein
MSRVLYAGSRAALSASSYGSRPAGAQGTFWISHSPGLPRGLKPMCSRAERVSQSRATGTPSRCTRCASSCALLIVRIAAAPPRPGSSSSTRFSETVRACLAEGNAAAESSFAMGACSAGGVSGARRSRRWKSSRLGRSTRLGRSSRLAALREDLAASSPEARSSRPPPPLAPGGGAACTAAARQHNAQHPSFASVFALSSMAAL